MTTTIESPAAPGAEAIEQAMNLFMGQFAGWYGCIGSAMGVRLGLFDALAHGPATSDELARRAGISPRYAEEWAKQAFCSGFLRHNLDTDTFELAPGIEQVLVDRGSPVYVGSALLFPLVIGKHDILSHLERAFVDGRGVPQSTYGSDTQDVLEQMSSMFADHFLVQSWLPAVPGLVEKLETGVDFADIGCGGGRMLIRMAQAFPNSRFTGIDRFEPALDLARRNVAAAGLGERIRFERSDGSGGLPGTYDIVSAFDVIHDASDPVGLLRAMRDALRSGGRCLIQETNPPEDLASLAGPLGTFLYGISMLYCMSVSLGEGGVGTGTVFPASKLEKVAREAGFEKVAKMAEMPFAAFYSLT